VFLRRLTLTHYGVFERAAFDLSTDVDHPLVLISGNNGAGKTSILEALRIALHGRRAFDVPMGDAEYVRTMTNRFHRTDLSQRCSVALEFDYVDVHKTRSVALERSWAVKRQHVAETLRVTLDGKALVEEDADDLLASIVPPEIARYFFFDGERIRELAEWEVEDESALFSAVSELLGLGVLDQLKTDLLRLSSASGKTKQEAQDVASLLEAAEDRARAAAAELRDIKSQSRKIRGAVDRARSDVRRIGALQQDEIAALESELGQLTAERRGLLEEAGRSAHDILPLLCAKSLRRRFGKEITARRRLEDRAVVAAFFERHSDDIASTIKKHAGLSLKESREVTGAIVRAAYGEPEPVSDLRLPSLSRSDAAWMQRVIERELPEMAERTRALVKRLRVIDQRMELLTTKRRDAPNNDPAGERALRELEARQRTMVEHEAALKNAEERNAQAVAALSAARDVVKARRLEAFRAGRLRVRERVMNQILDAIPVLSRRLQVSKEQRFARYLREALRELWNKTDRLVDVDVSFADRRIALLGAFGEIRKRDLSAGEKQLFAVAFIYALARLSGRLMPFVIDTPLGRLDQQHRRRFVAEFLPNASHQVVLLSTDTEIVGPLYEDLHPLLARHHELADFNGGITSRVQVATA
jgi:DNA sulfur modification protein DndD